MDKLSNEPGALPSTSGELFAVVPTHISGADDEFKSCSFYASAMSPIVTVRWPATQEIALVPREIAVIMLRENYARRMTDAEIEAYNAAADAQGEPAPDDGGDTTQGAPVTGGDDAPVSEAPASETPVTEAPSARVTTAPVKAPTFMSVRKKDK